MDWAGPRDQSDLADHQGTVEVRRRPPWRQCDRLIVELDCAGEVLLFEIDSGLHQETTGIFRQSRLGLEGRVDQGDALKRLLAGLRISRDSHLCNLRAAPRLDQLWGHDRL